MTYSELTDLCYARKISLTSVAESAGMTLRGFRDGVNKRTLGIKALEAICKTLDISPNEFLGWEEKRSTFNTTQVGVMNSQQIGSVGIEMLHQQLSIKDEQIMLLHEQIKQLLNLLKQ